MLRLLLLIVLFTGFRLLPQQAGGIATASAATAPEEYWYQIELVIFENLGSALDSTEIWPQDPGQPQAENAIELIALSPPPPVSAATAEVIAEEQRLAHLGLAATRAQDDGRPTPFILLEPDEFSLVDTVKKLKVSRSYKPLIHIAWRQPVPSREQAKPIHVNTRDIITRQRLAATPGMDDSSSSENNANTQQLALNSGDDIATEVIDNFVEGYITVVRERYLHLYLDLLYQQTPVEAPLFSFFGMGNALHDVKRFRAEEKRRLRSGELHYFDHPKFGMIAKITPFDDTQEEDEPVNIIPLR